MFLNQKPLPQKFLCAEVSSSHIRLGRARRCHRMKHGLPVICTLLTFFSPAARMITWDRNHELGGFGDKGSLGCCGDHPEHNLSWCSCMQRGFPKGCFLVTIKIDFRDHFSRRSKRKWMSSKDQMQRQRQPRSSQAGAKQHSAESPALTHSGRLKSRMPLWPVQKLLLLPVRAWASFFDLLQRSGSRIIGLGTVLEALDPAPGTNKFQLGRITYK